MVRCMMSHTVTTPLTYELSFRSMLDFFLDDNAPAESCGIVIRMRSQTFCARCKLHEWPVSLSLSLYLHSISQVPGFWRFKVSLFYIWELSSFNSTISTGPTRRTRRPVDNIARAHGLCQHQLMVSVILCSAFPRIQCL